MAVQDRIELLRSRGRYELSDNRLTLVAPGFGLGSVHYWDGSWDNDADELPLQMREIFENADGDLRVEHRDGRQERLVTDRRVWWPHAIHATTLGESGTIWHEAKCIVEDVAVDVVKVVGSGLGGRTTSIAHEFGPEIELEQIRGGVRVRSTGAKYAGVWRCLGFAGGGPVKVMKRRGRWVMTMPFKLESEQSGRFTFAVAAGEDAGETEERWRRVLAMGEEAEAAARTRWTEFFDEHVPEFSCDEPKWERLFAASFYVLRANLYDFKKGAIQHPYSCPSKWRLCPSWFWDPCFHGFAEKWLRNYPAPISTFRNHFDVQESDGYLPMTVDARGNTWRAMGANAKQCQQFLHPMTIWDWYLVHGNREVLKECLPHLVAHADYISTNRQPDAWPLFLAENGAEVADNSARLVRDPSNRGALGTLRTKIQPFDWNTFLYLSERLIARMAAETGENNVRKTFASRAARRVKFLKRCWNPRNQLFSDRIVPGGRLSERAIPESLLALLGGFASPTQQRAGIAFLTDPNRLWTRFPVPTLPLDDPDFSDRDDYSSYWNGRVWPNMNWCHVEALARAGKRRVGRELLDRCLEMAVEDGEPQIRENYRPRTAEPYAQPHCSLNYGWGAVCADLLIRRAIGLQVNTPAGTVSLDPWGLPGCKSAEVKGIPMGGQKIDVRVAFESGKMDVRVGRRKLRPIAPAHWLDL